MERELTELSDPVTIADRRTTILGEFQEGRVGKCWINQVSSNRLGATSSQYYALTIATVDGPGAFFAISAASAEVLRGQRLCPSWS